MIGRLLGSRAGRALPRPAPALAARTPVRGYSADAPAQQTFANQARLPRLPVPSLKATAARYLQSLVPLLSADEYARSERAVSAFIGPDGMGPVLQQRLLEVDRQVAHSWLEDIWLNKAYLEWRDPSYINVNWFAAIVDNPDYRHAGPLVRGQATEAQLGRAARFVTHMLEANEALNRQQMPPDTQRGEPLCMNQFRWQFGTSRIARPHRDEVVGQYPSTARHVLLMYRNQTVEVPVYNAAGQRASLAQITAQLAAAVRATDKRLAAQRGGPPQPSVANLTAGHRDDWAAARAALQRDPGNRESLAKADSALFGVCLDVDVDAPDIADPERRMAVFAHSAAGANRWFDKAIQLVFLGDGSMGVNCEHTPVDALTTARLLMEGMARETGPLKDTAPCSALPAPAPIEWSVGADVAQAVAKTRAAAGALAANLRLRLGDAAQYGAQWIKSLGVSPDAFFQVALQAAYYRHHGRAAATYESASLRRFLHGRTETIRSCTRESLAFSAALWGRRDAAPLGRKLQLFQQAVAAHIEYSRAAAAGQGVDRHLLGLRAQIRSPEEAERAALFQDPAFAKSSTFVLSTSNVTPGDRFRGAFAPVTPDGYGICYALDRADIKFGVADWLSSSATDGPAFRNTIYETLAELHAVGEDARARKLLS
ncbi:hypothetical protein H4R18_001919 [Coemansia javaensis]|uniref:Choline/carnitine acyltransferase domain-containing protein n=1 Tax=Coemansia javaensis TaxID=2761396 RepID=A0A9W8HEA1_9FUNG|nr:hypothetical protein H4R18_001919 [Coemansia javaensis]